MKHFQLYTTLLLISINIISSITEVKVNTELYTETVAIEKMNNYYQISLDTSASPTYKFIKITTYPTNNTNPAYLYVSNTSDSPGQKTYDVSSINKGNNTLYIPRTYFESKQYFYLNTFCERYCDYIIEMQQVEFMIAERSERLDFLTFDYEDYLIKFEKSETSSQLMITASGGARGHHGSKNNVKLSLYYHCTVDNTDTYIDVNSNTMFNGAGTTFYEKSYIKDGEGYFYAKVKGPDNTFISFMVRKIGVSCDLPVETKAIYGFLQGDDIDTFEVTNHGITPENLKQNEDRIFQVSIVVKGDLLISKSLEELCGEEGETESVNIMDELQAIITFNATEIAEGKTHICIQGQNQYVKSNAYIIEIHEVTNQKTSTIVTEPLVNGYIYTDYLKLDEVRSYRHSKYIGEGYTKYNVKLNQGLIKVVYITCNNFPTCYFDKDVVNGLKPAQYKPVELPSFDNYYTTNIDKSLETNAYGPKQILLTVLCLTEKCQYEVSFSDEEDSLVLRENSRVAHFVTNNTQNYYHFKIERDSLAQKVIVYLRTFSGDSNIDVCDDAKEQKRYYIENTEILEFYDNQYTGLYTLNVTSSVASFYLLSYLIIKPDEKEEEKVYDIGMGITLMESIKNGQTQKSFSMFHDKTRGTNLSYVANFYPINCNISVSFFDEKVTSINNIYQHEIYEDNPYYNEDYYIYKVNFISFNDFNSTYDDKLCLFYISSQEISQNGESSISEGASIGFTLTSKTKNPSFLYPHSAGESDILIKYNLENNFLTKMDININGNPQSSVYFSRSSSHVIPKNDIKNYCPEYQVCGIKITFSSNFGEIKNDNEIPINFIIKSKDNTPSTLSKNVLLIDLVAQNSTQYYVVDINPKDKGDIIINFKKGSGRMFAKMVGKDADIEDNSDWNNRVNLPKAEDEESNTVSNYDHYLQYIHYDTEKLFKYGLPVCQNGCDLYIGVISNDEIKSDFNQNDYLEYSIYVKPEIDTESSDPDEHQKLITQKMIDIPANEYITGFIKDVNDINYIYFDVTNDCDFIEIEFQSELCTLYINEGEKFPDPGNAKWTVESKLSKSIFNISNKDIGVDNLKGHEFKMAINSKKFDENGNMLYIMRVRVSKRTMETIKEINSNLDTVCEIKEENSYCDFVYPLSDYEYESGSSLFVYAESEIISDLVIFYNSVNGYLFDNMNEKEIQEIIPRENNYTKSSQNQNIKNYLEITYNDLHPEQLKNIKPFALISIKSNKPAIITIYTSMREQVLSTSVNPYANLLFNRNKNNSLINFNIKGEQSYNFYITCIDGEGKAYFKSQENLTDTYKTISGSGSLISLSLPQKKDDILIVEIDQNKGLKFIINENINPEVRSMNLIKFGYSGKISYKDASNLKFPLIYYMKIYDETESVNINLHLDNYTSSFNPTDGGNYTDGFDIYGNLVDEDMISSMKKNKYINPSTDDAIVGRYDKALTTAKLYITAEQIQNFKTDSTKFIVITVNKNYKFESTIQSLSADVSMIPFSNLLYNSPYNLYISGNLLKAENAKECNYHRLRAGNEDDKYMKIEYATLSKNLLVFLADINGININYVQNFEFTNGKNTGIIELKKENNIEISLCRKDKFQHEASTNYIFKVQTSTENNFEKFSLKSNNVEYSFENDKENNVLKLEFPKILNKEENKAVAATYTIRIIPKSEYDPNDMLNTISFISYYPYATYIYKIFGNEEDEKVENIIKYIENFPTNVPYIVTIIGVTENDEEIFAYKEIVDPYKKPDNESESNGGYQGFVIGIIVVIIILAVVFGYILFKMCQRKMQLDKEIRNVSGQLGNVSRFSGGENVDPTNEPFIKRSSDL